MTTTFTIELHHNRYLPPAGGRLDAVVEVVSDAWGSARTTPNGLGGEVLLLDVSSSMEGPKLAQASKAAVSAIGCIRDGVPFAVVAGNERARQVYPTTGMAPATASTRATAARAVRRLKARGGTAIGEWLSMATRLLSPAVGIRHAILLTDGRDEHESPDSLDAAIRAAEGVFQCDCRGIGIDWRVEELREIASSLLGSIDIVAHPSDLTNDFTEMMVRSMDRQVADVAIRVRTASGVTERGLKQVLPDLVDLTPEHLDGKRTAAWYATGAWGSERRAYHLTLDVPPRRAGECLQLLELAVVADDQVAAEVNLEAAWTDSDARVAAIDPTVAHYTGQQQLADAIRDGLALRRSGDAEAATETLGVATRLAWQTDSIAIGHLLNRLVDVEDWSTGTVRLKPFVSTSDEMTLDTRSTRTVRRSQ